MPRFDDLRRAMADVGISAADGLPFQPNGRLRRFRLAGDKPRTQNGFVTVFDNGDGSVGASFGSWRDGTKHTWFSGKPRQELNPAQRREYAQKMAADKAQREAEQQQRHHAAAEKATQLWSRAEPAAANHPYLARKQVQSHGLRQLNGSLLVPVNDSAGQLVGLQFIDADGSKRFLSGTQIKGSFHRIGPAPADVVLLAEGYATAATLHQATGHPCIIAFSAGNLRPVAENIRTKYPQATIVICSDDDPVGRAAAQEAAAAVDGLWIAPQDDDFQKKGDPANGE